MFGRFGKAIATAVLVVLAIPVAASAKHYYVSPGGSDSRPCDLAGAPCKTIGQAIAKAQQLPGTHVINVAARHAGSRAVYRESIRLRQGSAHLPRIVVDGSWGAAVGGRALIAPIGAGPPQVALLELPGAELRNIDVDSAQATGAAAGVVLEAPGSEHRLRDVKIRTATGDVALVVNSPSAVLRWVDALSTNSPTLDYGAPGVPVLMQDSVMRQAGATPVIRGSGTSSLIFRRSVAWATTAANRVIATEGGRLFLDSALVSGGSSGAIHLGGATGPSLRAVSSTIDVGARGVADPGLAAVTLATGGNAEVELIGSILVEPPLITVAGTAMIVCSHTDIPSTVVQQESPPQTIACGSGSDGNVHTDPGLLFAGTPPFAGIDGYRLRMGSPAINTGPHPAPHDATPFDLDGEARIQPPGTCADSEDVIDKGAFEFGCTAVAGSPRPPNLRETLFRPPPRPVIRGQRAIPRRIARGRPARIQFHLNTPARVIAVITERRRAVKRAGAGRRAKGAKILRIRRVLKNGGAGRNRIALPTRRLAARPKAYRVRLIAHGPSGKSKPAVAAFRVIPRPQRRPR